MFSLAPVASTTTCKEKIPKSRHLNLSPKHYRDFPSGSSKAISTIATKTPLGIYHLNKTSFSFCFAKWKERQSYFLRYQSSHELLLAGGFLGLLTVTLCCATQLFYLSVLPSKDLPGRPLQFIPAVAGGLSLGSCHLPPKPTSNGSVSLPYVLPTPIPSALLGGTFSQTQPDHVALGTLDTLMLNSHHTLL